MSSSDTGAPVRAPLHLAVALDGAGRHPAATGGPGARVRRADLVRTAERGLLDLVTVDAPPDAGRWPDGRIGLVPAVTRPGPLRIASALSALDHDSSGRAGWLLRTPDGPRSHGRLVTPAARARFAGDLDRAADTVAVVRRLWDSAAGGSALHHVDLHGDHGPTTVAPPPQGQLPVLVAASGWETFRLAARTADVVLTTPVDAFGAAAVVEQVRDAERDVGRAGQPLRVLTDVVVLLDDTVAAARDRLDRLDAAEPLLTDAAVVATTPSVLADMLLAWARSGIDGYRLVPARPAEDLDRIVDGLVPELQRRAAFRTRYEGTTLREHLGLTPSGAGRAGLPAAAAS